MKLNDKVVLMQLLQMYQAEKAEENISRKKDKWGNVIPTKSLYGVDGLDTTVDKWFCLRCKYSRVNGSEHNPFKFLKKQKRRENTNNE